MFEGQLWADADPSWDEPLPLSDGPERSELDYLADLEWAIANDPENRPEPTAAEVIARGETEPVTPALIGQLWQLDPATLGEDDAVGYAVAMDRVANAAHGRRGLGVARLATVSPDGAEVPREQHAAGQLVPTLGIGFGAAGELVAEAMQIVKALPATRAMTQSGELSWRKAATIASATGGLSSEHAERVEQLVLPKARQRPLGAHDAAVRSAVDRVDPDGVEARRREQRRDIRMARHHYGNGRAQVFLELPSDHADRIWLAADTWARRRKNDGDPRPLRELRVACWLSWADSFLTHADPHTCDRGNHHPAAPVDSDIDTGDTTDTDTRTIEDAVTDRPQPDPAAPASSPSLPHRHGRSVVQTVTWDLTSLLGLTNHAAHLLDSDTTIAPSTVREMIAGGVRVRRGIINADGHLEDLTPQAWFLPPTNGSGHRLPVELLLTTTATPDRLPLDIQWTLQDLHHTDPTLAAVLTELLAFPLTADELDAHPDDAQPGARLAAYICMLAGHPINPGAGPTPATTADLEHHQARSQGGKTQRDNLGPVARRWHRLKTFDSWTVQQTPDGWQWTSPTGRKYLVEPFDYRLGP